MNVGFDSTQEADGPRVMLFSSPGIKNPKQELALDTHAVPLAPTGPMSQVSEATIMPPVNGNVQGVHKILPVACTGVDPQLAAINSAKSSCR